VTEESVREGVSEDTALPGDESPPASSAYLPEHDGDIDEALDHPDESPQEYGELGGQVAQLLKAADEIRAGAVKEAAELRRRAASEVEAQRRSLIEEVKHIYAEAEANAKETRHNADAYAEEHRRNAEEQESRTLADADARRTEMLSEAKERARQILDEARQHELELREQAGLFEKKMWTVVDKINLIASELQDALGRPAEDTGEPLVDVLDSQTRRKFFERKGNQT